MNLLTKKLMFTGCILSLSILLIEALLHGFSYLSIKTDSILGGTYWEEKYMPLPDERLGFRPNPNHPENDARGFRNVKALKKASMVALGDSQTQGQGAKLDQAWPQQVAQLADFPVYNMGFGGYGPVHAWLLLNEALALGPEIIVLGLYSGNDLYDCYDLVYERDKISELKTQDQIVLESIRDANNHSALEQQVAKSFHGHDHSKPRQLLSQWSKIYALLRAVKNEMLFGDKWEVQKNRVASNRSYIVFEAGDIRTILTPQYRLTALDLNDPRIQEGRRLTFQVISLMHAETIKHEVKFVVLLLPTKELVYKQILNNITALGDTLYDELINNELKFWEKTKNFCFDQGIECIDVLPAMRQILDAKRNPYASSSDGHPNAEGYRAIANAIIVGLSKRGWL